MMYGFGDAKEQDPETVELMEEIVLDYITDTVRSDNTKRDPTNAKMKRTAWNLTRKLNNND